MSELNNDEFREKREALKAELKRYKIAGRLAMYGASMILKRKVKKADIPKSSLCGFLEGTMIANPLAHPSDNVEWLEHKSVLPGKWAAYDHRRLKEFPDIHEQGKLIRVFDGRLGAFLLEQVIENPPEKLTPIGTLDILNFDHMLEFNPYSAEQMVDLGLLQQSTYKQAYQELGIYEQFADEFESRRINVENPVYQVTPKGNTLVILFQDGGHTKSRDLKQPSPAWDPLLKPA